MKKKKQKKRCCKLISLVQNKLFRLSRHEAINVLVFLKTNHIFTDGFINYSLFTVDHTRKNE